MAFAWSADVTFAQRLSIVQNAERPSERLNAKGRRLTDVHDTDSARGQRHLPHKSHDRGRSEEREIGEHSARHISRRRGLTCKAIVRKELFFGDHNR